MAWFRAQYPHYAMLLVHPIKRDAGIHRWTADVRASIRPRVQ